MSILEPIPASLEDKKAAQLLFVQILFSLAEFTRSVTIENINNGLAQKKHEKRLLSSKPPFGYIHQKGKFVPHREESRIVQQIFSEYTSTDMGYKRIAKQLNQEGRCFHRNPFKSYHVAQIIKNPVYTGVIGSKSKNLTSYQSQQIVSIISQEVFEQATNKRLNRTINKNNTRDYPLREKLVCPVCQRKLTPRKQVSRGKNYHYYSCQNESCSQLLVNAEKVETSILNILSDYLSRDNQFKSLIGALEHQIEEVKQAKKRSLADTSNKKQQLFQSFEDGKIDRDNLKEQLKIINKQQGAITQIDLSEEELAKRLRLFLKLSQTSSKEMMWSYIEEVRIDKNKQIQEVNIYGIRIQPRNY